MPRKKPVDPADAHNQRILAQRQERIKAKQATKVQEATDTQNVTKELNLEPPPATNAVEYLADAWDKGVFGDQGQVPTYKRLVYGPDPLLESNPHMREQIERIGLESYAHATAEAMISKGWEVVADPIMRRGLRGAIERFGVESVAAAFRERILKIPVREVEIEADREDYAVLDDPLRNAVERYGSPGFVPKFMCDRSVAILGMRGYEVVHDENGDVVRVGTLFMTQIPKRIADARARRLREENQQAVSDMEEQWLDKAERLIHETGAADGTRPLARDEIMHANATEAEEYIGRNAPAGIQIERQR